MKTIPCLLVLVMLFAVLLLPSQIYAQQGQLCSKHPCKTCLVKDRDLCCSWTETITKSKVVRGRAGMVELVNERVIVPVTKCVGLEDSTGR